MTKRGRNWSIWSRADSVGLLEPPAGGAVFPAACAYASFHMGPPVLQVCARAGRSRPAPVVRRFDVGARGPTPGGGAGTIVSPLRNASRLRFRNAAKRPA